MQGFATPILLILGGYPGSGKSTFANAILENRPNVKRVSFGQGAKDLTYRLDPYVREKVDQLGEAEAKKDPRVRKAYQDMGLHLGEVLGDTVFSAAKTLEIARLLKAGTSVICDDARRPPEFTLGEAIAQSSSALGFSFGHLAFRVSRPGNTAPDHPIERQLDNHGPLVINSGTKEELERGALRVFDGCQAKFERARRAQIDPLALLDFLREDPQASLRTILSMLRA